MYVFFNGEFDNLKESYGNSWNQTTGSVAQRTFSGPKQSNEVAASLSQPDPLPESLMDLIYSAVDQLYGIPNLSEAIRRLRLSRVRAANANESALLPVIDSALDQLEAPLPRVNEVTWFLEEALTELESTR